VDETTAYYYNARLWLRRIDCTDEPMGGGKIITQLGNDSLAVAGESSENLPRWNSDSSSNENDNQAVCKKTFVERAFVISLEFRQDRLNEFRNATDSLSSIPKIEVWPAVHGDTCRPPESWMAGAGAWGCYRSHLQILEYCLNNRVSSYLVFEDDAKFREGFDTGFSAFCSALPDYWQQAYIGGQLLHTHTHPTVKVNEHVYRPYNVNRTHAFAVSRAGMLPIYQHISNLPFVEKEHVDHHLGRWHEDQRNYVYVPPKWLVGQQGSSSNVSGKTEPPTYFDDPASTFIDHWLYRDPLCVVFRGPREVLQQSRTYLHQGNQIDASGFDVTLSLAAKFADPIPEIDRWYGWIRGEVVRSNSKALPCLFHPRITNEMLSKCGFRFIECNARTIHEVKEFHESIEQ
jgi:GR25 family glycosyltransferase involved in LPS biosynthesis